MQPTFIVKHPNLLTAAVTIRKIRRAERIRLEEARQRACIVPTAVYEQDGRTPIRKANGEVQAFVLTHDAPIETLNAELSAMIVAVSNVPTADGQTVVTDVSGVIRKEIDGGLFWDDHLDCRITGRQFGEVTGTLDALTEQLRENAIAKGRDPDAFVEEALSSEMTMPFARYILNVYAAPKTFDPVPNV